jgi:hypothetical protein
MLTSFGWPKYQSLSAACPWQVFHPSLISVRQARSLPFQWGFSKGSTELGFRPTNVVRKKHSSCFVANIIKPFFLLFFDAPTNSIIVFPLPGKYFQPSLTFAIKVIHVKQLHWMSSQTLVYLAPVSFLTITKQLAFVSCCQILTTQIKK